MTMIERIDPGARTEGSERALGARLKPSVDRLRRNRRTGMTCVAAVGVAVALLATSVSMGLRLPAVEHLSGYPAAAQLLSDRPPTGFVPLTQRFISNVLGLATGARSDNSATQAAARAGRSPGEGGGAASPRVTVSHAFTNDSFGGAYVVPAVPFTGRTATHAATREPGESTACAPVGGTAWYRYTAVADQRLRALTLGSDYALALGVFTGDRANAVQPVGCNNGPSGSAQVGFRAARGETYYFQVTGVAGGGNLVFSLNPVGRTDRVSVSSSGAQADDASALPSVSADGRFVSFNSAASNLTPNQDHCMDAPPGRNFVCSQVFVHDRVGRSMSLVSVSSSGEQAEGTAGFPSISRGGRYVAFQAYATNLAPGAANTHVYVRDRATGITERVSEPASADPNGGGGFAPGISDDGRYVVFLSSAHLIGPPPPPQPCIPQDMCGPSVHVYVRDRVTRTTTLVSEAHAGGYANGGTNPPPSRIQGLRPTISADGRFVAFHSAAADLVPGDTNRRVDVFVRDLHTRRTERVSVSDAGTQGDDSSFGGGGGGRYVSADGRYVAFWSEATNLVPGDTNEATDFFVRDRVLRTTARVSVSSEGTQGRDAGTAAISTAGGLAISDDGRFVSFDSGLVDLANDTPKSLQVYVRDLARGITTVGSATSLGEAGNYHSMMPALSASGDVVAFSSGASNFVANDNNVGCVGPLNTLDNCPDIFVHELAAP